MTTPILTLAADLLVLAGKVPDGPWFTGSSKMTVYSLNEPAVLARINPSGELTPEMDETISVYIAKADPSNITSICNAVNELSDENERLREALERLQSKYGSDEWVTDQDEMAGIVLDALAAREKT